MVVSVPGLPLVVEQGPSPPSRGSGGVGRPGIGSRVYAVASVGTLVRGAGVLAVLLVLLARGAFGGAAAVIAWTAWAGLLAWSIAAPIRGAREARRDRGGPAPRRSLALDLLVLAFALAVPAGLLARQVLHERACLRDAEALVVERLKAGPIPGLPPGFGKYRTMRGTGYLRPTPVWDIGGLRGWVFARRTAEFEGGTMSLLLALAPAEAGTRRVTVVVNRKHDHFHAVRTDPEFTDPLIDASVLSPEFLGRTRWWFW